LVGIGMDPQASKVHWILFPSEQILEYVYYFSQIYYKIYIYISARHQTESGRFFGVRLTNVSLSDISV